MQVGMKVYCEHQVTGHPVTGTVVKVDLNTIVVEAADELMTMSAEAWIVEVL